MRKLTSPTLRDVAAAAGVSLTTASCVLGTGRRGVSDALRARVEAAADELGYELHPRGRRRTQSLSIGVVVPSVTNAFFTAVIGALGGVLGQAGHHLVVAPSGDDPQAEDELVRLLSPRIDGLAIAPADQIGRATRELAARGVPVVVFDRVGGAIDLPSVVMDNFESAQRATMILVESGFERIALVNGPQRIATARERTRGYLAALEAAGLQASDDRIWLGEFTMHDGRRAVDWLLQGPERPDAIFSSSAMITPGVLAGLREHGVSWPHDMAVVGFGDGVFAQLVEPAVTVIEQPTQAMGETVARLLLTRPAANQPPAHVVLESMLVLRDSHWRSAPARSVARRSPRRSALAR